MKLDPKNRIIITRNGKQIVGYRGADGVIYFEG